MGETFSSSGAALFSFANSEFYMHFPASKQIQFSAIKLQLISSFPKQENSRNFLEKPPNSKLQISSRNLVQNCTVQILSLLQLMLNSARWDSCHQMPNLSCLPLLEILSFLLQNEAALSLSLSLSREEWISHPLILLIKECQSLFISYSKVTLDFSISQSDLSVTFTHKIHFYYFL